jgi:predicted metal-dependent enzyme (double-stranded beta helix superfamily)
MKPVLADRPEVSAVVPASPAVLATPVSPARRPVALAAPVSPARLGELVRAIAGRPAEWLPIVQFSRSRRWYTRLSPEDPAAGYEIWLLSWLPGQQTGFHDHGDAVGAFAIADGALQESTARAGERQVGRRVLGAGAVRAFGAAYMHDVCNISAAPAVSVHAYSPPLSAMRRYEMTGSGLALTSIESADETW